MLTIFTIPKAFDDAHINIIQRNAIQSWMQLKNTEIILVGRDNGVKGVADEFGLKNISEVEYNEHGTPLLDSAFKLVSRAAQNKKLCYVNADIIFLNNFIESIKLLPEKNFLAVGRRIDLDIKEKIDYINKDWQKRMETKIKDGGKLHSYSGIDYFIFNIKSFNNLPPLAVGRIGWDHWMILEARRKKMKVIDATEIITAVHQNHDYPNFNKDKQRKINPEAQKNISYIKNKAYDFTIEDANWKLTKKGLKRKWLYWWPFLKRNIKLLIGN